MKKVSIVLTFVALFFSACGVIEPPTATQQGNGQHNDTPSNSRFQYEIIPFSQRIHETRRDHVRFQVVKQIVNTGTDPISFGQQRFDILDDDGRLLEANNTIFSSPSIIHPGEVGVIYGNSTINDGTLYAAVSPDIHLDIRRSINSRSDVSVSEIEIRDVPGFSPTVLGRITNNTGVNTGLVQVWVNLYDHDGSPLGVWFTNIASMDADASFGFEIRTTDGRIFQDFVDAEMVGGYSAFADAHVR